MPQRVEMKDVTLGPGDEIELSVYRHSDLNRRITIPPSGTIFVPLAGEIDVAGTSAIELRRRISALLEKYIVDPQVSVTVVVNRSQKVVVLGEVNQPGVFTMDGPTNTFEAIGLAGGFTQSASRAHMVLLRLENGKPARRVIDVDRAIADGRFESIRKGDVVYVPPSTVANIDRFAQHLTTWLTPILLTTQGIRLGQDIDRVFGGQTGQVPIVITP